MAEFPVYMGNCPRNVAKDAKYSIRSNSGGNNQSRHVVALTYRSIEDERWYATTDDHADLVSMVNAVKLSIGLPPNGGFYINEYKQVIVPNAESEDYYLGGTYERPLRFEFEGKTLSGEPVDLEGNPISPGDTWVGPHPGIPYVLCAGGSDIKYTTRPRPNVRQEHKLSKAVGSLEAKTMAARIRAVKGFEGGRFYVNEFGSIFTPVADGAVWRYVYIGPLDFGSWFPMPMSGA